MKIKVVIHEVEEGEFWAGVPAISGCAKGKPWNGFCRIYTKRSKAVCQLFTNKLRVVILNERKGNVTIKP